MKLDENKIDQYKSLKREINSCKTFGVKSGSEILKAQAMENELLEDGHRIFTDDFIRTHTWKQKHLHNIKFWDIINYKNNICRIQDMWTTSYNRGLDTFNYKASLLMLYTGETKTIEFGYYETTEIIIYE